MKPCGVCGRIGCTRPAPTLAQWIEEAPCKGQFHAGGAYVVPFALVARTLETELYHLTDYRVSSVAGGAIWLVPRERAE